MGYLVVDTGDVVQINFFCYVKFIFDKFGKVDAIFSWTVRPFTPVGGGMKFQTKLVFFF